MTAADAAQVAVLCGQLDYASTEAQVKGRFDQLCASDENAILVACHGDTVVGWIHCNVNATLETDPYVEIRGLVVDAQFRRSGIGRDLMAAAEAWATQRNILHVRLRSNITRADAHAFYERLGYRKVKTQFAFDKHLEGG